MKRKGWKVKIERPEEIFGSPEKFYTGEEIEKYAKSSHMKRAQRRLMLRIIENLNITPPAKILDLGCGTGYSTELLKELGFEVIGIDILDEMLKYAIKKGLNVKKADMRNLTEYFNEKEFDYVVSTSALQWVSIGERRKVAEGCYYVLKDGGKIGIHFYPKSEDEMLRTGRIFERAGFEIEFIIDNLDVPRKRTIYMVGNKLS